jgi:hypothetical protein
MTSNSIRSASRKCGVPEATLRRWLGDDDFREALSLAQNECIGHAVRRLCWLTNKAVSTLADCMDGRGDMMTLKAAIAVLDQVRAMTEHTELKRELEELRTLADEHKRIARNQTGV